jgi:hypothetical protein
MQPSAAASPTRNEPNELPLSLSFLSARITRPKMSGLDANVDSAEVKRAICAGAIVLCKKRAGG